MGVVSASLAESPPRRLASGTVEGSDFVETDAVSSDEFTAGLALKGLLEATLGAGLCVRVEAGVLRLLRVDAALLPTTDFAAEASGVAVPGVGAVLEPPATDAGAVAVAVAVTIGGIVWLTGGAATGERDGEGGPPDRPNTLLTIPSKSLEGS